MNSIQNRKTWFASYPISTIQGNVGLSCQPHVLLLSSHAPDCCFLVIAVFLESNQLVDMETPHVVLEAETVWSCSLKVRQANTARIKTRITKKFNLSNETIHTEGLSKQKRQITLHFLDWTDFLVPQRDLCILVIRNQFCSVVLRKFLW